MCVCIYVTTLFRIQPGLQVHNFRPPDAFVLQRSTDIIFCSENEHFNRSSFISSTHFSINFPPCFCPAGLSLAAVWTCVVHAGYFLLCAVVLTFLRCPSFSRAMLLFTVPLNAVAEVNQQPALDLPSLSMLLLTLSLGTGRVFCVCVAAPLNGNHKGVFSFFFFFFPRPVTHD